MPEGEILPGDVVRVTATLANARSRPVSGVDSTLTAPAGWQVTPVGTHPTTVAGSGTVAHAYDVVVPADARAGTVGLTGTVSYGGAGGTATLPVSADLMVSPGVAIASATTAPDAVAGGATATLTAVLRNRTTVTQTGDLTVGVPAGWTAPDPVPFELAAGEQRDVTVEVTVPWTVAAGDASLVVATGPTAAERTTAPLHVVLPVPPGGAVDHVDLGDGASETAHRLTASEHSGTNVEAGLTRRYTHSSYPGGWFELDAAVPAEGRFVVRVIETFDGARRKTYDVLADGQVVHSVDLTRTAGGEGTIVHQFLVEPSAATADGTVRLRFRDTAGDYDPSVADLWVLPVP
ncbi:MAG TPA: NEW3 domain-containing protein [Nocardioides sp.]|nr:NEW3 domain-containing protein [Nocardioides sp.]